MSWIDTLDDRQQKEMKLARLYATKEFSHGTTGHNALLLIAKLAELLDDATANAALARIAAMDDRPPLQQILAGARNAGAATWIVRGATWAELAHADEDGETGAILAIAPPHEIIVLVRIPRGDGEPNGITFYGPEERDLERHERYWRARYEAAEAAAAHFFHCRECCESEPCPEGQQHAQRLGLTA